MRAVVATVMSWLCVPVLVVIILLLAPIAFVGQMIEAWRQRPTDWWHRNVKL